MLYPSDVLPSGGSIGLHTPSIAGSYPLTYIPLSCRLRPPLHQSAGRLHMNECHVKRGHQLLGLCEEAS